MSKPHVIQGLRWARELPGKPSCIPNGRARGKKAAGVRYERELAKALPQARHGQWFEYSDSSGTRYCQPDIILNSTVPIAGGVRGCKIVLEAKYTWVEQGQLQISKLYRPVLEKVYGCPVFGIVVCKVLTPITPQGAICRDLESAAELAKSGWPVVLHWLGGLGPLRLQPSAGHLAESRASM